MRSGQGAFPRSVPVKLLTRRAICRCASTSPCGERLRNLKPERISVGKSRLRMLASERADCGRFIEPDERVELLRQRGVGVMTHQFGLGAIDHADEALQPLR